MTLVVAVATERGTWMGGERYAGDFCWTELVGPKIFELETQDGHPFSIGFAGAPRVAQVMLAVEPPARENRSLHWWMTEYCDRFYRRCSDLGSIVDRSGGSGAELAGSTGAILAIDGRVFLLDSELCWEEPARGYVAQGGAFEAFAGAYEVLRDQHADPIEAARFAWPVVQRRHRIGPLVDEITLGVTGGSQ